jgi:hypothetical protein
MRERAQKGCTFRRPKSPDRRCSRTAGLHAGGGRGAGERQRRGAGERQRRGAGGAPARRSGAGRRRRVDCAPGQSGHYAHPVGLICSTRALILRPLGCRVGASCAREDGAAMSRRRRCGGRRGIRTQRARFASFELLSAHLSARSEQSRMSCRSTSQHIYGAGATIRKSILPFKIPEHQKALFSVNVFCMGI